MFVNNVAGIGRESSMYLNNYKATIAVIQKIPKGFSNIIDDTIF